MPFSLTSFSGKMSESCFRTAQLVLMALRLSQVQLQLMVSSPFSSVPQTLALNLATSASESLAASSASRTQSSSYALHVLASDLMTSSLKTLMTWKLMRWMCMGWPKAKVLIRYQSSIEPMTGFSLKPSWKSIRPLMVSVWPTDMRGLKRFTAILSSGVLLRSVQATHLERSILLISVLVFLSSSQSYSRRLMAFMLQTLISPASSKTIPDLVIRAGVVMESMSVSPHTEKLCLPSPSLMISSILSPLLMTKWVWFSIPWSKREESAPMMVNFSRSGASLLHLLQLKEQRKVALPSQLALRTRKRQTVPATNPSRSYIWAARLVIRMNLSFSRAIPRYFCTLVSLRMQKPARPYWTLKLVNLMAWSWYQRVPGFCLLGQRFTLKLCMGCPWLSLSLMMGGLKSSTPFSKESKQHFSLSENMPTPNSFLVALLMFQERGFPSKAGLISAPWTWVEMGQVVQEILISEVLVSGWMVGSSKVMVALVLHLSEQQFLWGSKVGSMQVPLAFATESWLEELRLLIQITSTLCLASISNMGPEVQPKTDWLQNWLKDLSLPQYWRTRFPSLRIESTRMTQVLPFRYLLCCLGSNSMLKRRLSSGTVAGLKSSSVAGQNTRKSKFEGLLICRFCSWAYSCSGFSLRALPQENSIRTAMSRMALLRREPLRESAIEQDEEELSISRHSSWWSVCNERILCILYIQKKI